MRLFAIPVGGAAGIGGTASTAGVVAAIAAPDRGGDAEEDVAGNAAAHAER